MPNGVHKHMEVEMEEPEERVHAVVIDGSSFTFIDSVGLHALPAVSIRVYLLLILDVNLQISPGCGLRDIQHCTISITFLNTRYAVTSLYQKIYTVKFRK